MLTNSQKTKLDDAIREDYQWLTQEAPELHEWEGSDPTNTGWMDVDGATSEAITYHLDDDVNDEAIDYADDQWERLATIYRRGGLEGEGVLDLKAAERAWNDHANPTKSGKRFASVVSKVVTAAMPERQTSVAEEIDTDEMRRLSRIGVPVANVQQHDPLRLHFESPWHEGGFWLSWSGKKQRWSAGGTR